MSDPLHAGTIVARNYLAQAQVLVESFRRHHPDGTFDVLLVDEPSTQRPEVRGADVMMIDELDIPAHMLDEMCVGYDLIELATALKPWFLSSLLGRGFDHATYFDPDIRIERPIVELPALAREHSVVLTPHLTEPMPRDGLHPSEQVILQSGSYNLGFISVGATDEGRRMLDWWGERLVTDSFIDHARGFFTDQKLVDLVPGLFAHHLVKDPSWNLAYWNAATRPVTRDHDGGWLIGGNPATFIHFSGYSPAVPHLFSKHQGARPRVLLSENPELRELCDGYGQQLVEAGFLDRQRGFRRPFEQRDGIEVTESVRRLVRDELTARRQRTKPATTELSVGLAGARRETGVPLDEWLATPDPNLPAGGLGRLLARIYLSRPDLHAAYPEVQDGRRENLLDWAELHGIGESGIPRAVIDRERDRLTSSDTSELLHRASRGRGAPAHGVETVGYLTAELGLGGTARLFVQAMQSADVPVSTSTYTRTSSRLGAPWTDIAAPSGVRYDVLLSCVNGDQLPYLVDDAGPRYFKRRHRIGLWFWELPELPDDVLPALDLVDEVWVCSQYNADAVSAVTDKPVTIIPHPAHAPERSETRIPEIADPDRFTFLFVFDQFSVMERKNPTGVIEAFKRAFPEPGKAQLVIKSINGDKRIEAQEKLRYASQDRPDIILVERYLSREELDGLMWNCDCYVSLHRSEGFGQTLAETMAIGKPVIATGYSGNLGFMTPDNSYLVDHTMTTVPAGSDPYPEGASWADPDIGQAAAYMREVFDDQAAAQARGRRAADDIALHHSVEATGRAIRARLDEVWAERDGRAERRAARQASGAETSLPGRSVLRRRGRTTG